MFEKRTHELRAAVTRLSEDLADLIGHVGELDEEKVWLGSGFSSTTRWLCAHFEITFSTAREWVRVARALRALSAISQAFRDGFFTWDQIRPLTLLATPESDVEWRDRAEGRSAGYLWEAWRQSLEIERHEEQDTHRWRYFDLEWNEEKTECYIAGRLGAEQGSVLEKEVRRRAATIDPGDAHDPASAARADALVGAVSETKRGRRPTPLLVVHADVRTLRGKSSGRVLAETDSGARLSAEAVQRIAGEAKIEWVLEQDGRCVGVGFQSKHPPEWLQRRLRERDGTCRFPGCGANRHLKAHHIRHWPTGRTDLDNLVLLCAFHHNLVHKCGWSIRGDPNGALEFVDPRGHTRATFPRRSRGDPRPAAA